MFNELLLFFHALLIGICALISLRLGSCALVAFISIQSILANLFVLKQTTLFGFTATCSDAFTIGGILGLNLLQEYFGKYAALRAIWTSFFLMIFYTVISQIHLMYIPSITDTTHALFYPLLSYMPRIVIASLIVYAFVAHLDAWLYGYLKKRLNDKHIVIRNYTSITVCQLIDTILFSFLGLYGIVENISHIILVSYTIKLIAIAIATPCVALSRVFQQK